VQDRMHYRAKISDTRAIIISPTRELAEQIAAEAKRLTSATNVVVQTAVGGTQKNFALDMMKRRGCHLLVATPGRLNDLLSDPYSGVEAPKLNTLVLDEADRLLEAGFATELRSILSFLPDPRERDRQTMMFSATVPREVIGLVRQNLKEGFHFVKCVDPNEAPTHQRVTQKVVNLRGYENMTPALIELCTRELETPGARPFKAIIYCNTTADVKLLADAFDAYMFKQRETPLRRARILDMHSKLSQSQRTLASTSFRNAERAILISSDVTSRGMDFPNVTHVIQLSPPRAREDYIHRIGRTGRAGKEGEGWLFMTSMSKRDIHEKLYDLPLQEDNSLVTASIDMTQPGKIPERAANILTNTIAAYRSLPREDKERSYTANLGTWRGTTHGQVVVDALNKLSKYGWGEPEPPTVSQAFVDKTGYRGVSGLNISHNAYRGGRGYGSGTRTSIGSHRDEPPRDALSEFDSPRYGDRSSSGYRSSGNRAPRGRRSFNERR
jgi:ATP-dependent RNA helicase MSS116, mitochondrial